MSVDASVMTPRLSIVVPTLDRRGTLTRVLPALAGQSVAQSDYEILLCDGGSTDGTGELVRETGIPNLRFVELAGSSRAQCRNTGVRLSRGRVVLFTDADILADSRLVEQHLQAHARYPGSAVVGREVQVASIEAYDLARASPSRRRSALGERRRRIAWIFFTTGNASAERDALERAGGFDESFTHYGHEDLELGYRLQQAGVEIRYEPEAVNYHWHPHSLGERLAKMEASGAATVRCYRKHRDPSNPPPDGRQPGDVGRTGRVRGEPASALAAEERGRPLGRGQVAGDAGCLPVRSEARVANAGRHRVIEVSVVIGTRNQAPVLEPVLASFADQTIGADRFEVVVVDSASEDDSASLCDRGQHPYALTYIRREDEGKAVARNIALAAARASLVVLTDADVLADRHFLERHWAAHVDHPGSVVVGQQFMVDAPIRHAPGARPCLNPSWRRGRRLSWRQFVTGNASCRLTLLREAGGFDTAFRHYGYEDYELGYRLAQRGARFLFEPGAVNYHFHPVSLEADIDRKRGAGHGAVQFALRHPSWRLRQHLGVTALNRLVYGAVKEEGSLVGMCRRLAARPSVVGRIAKRVVLESAFQQGMRTAWKESERERQR